ncbi:MAG: ABC transporter ATP-binding protein [Pseudobdellovibrionaceae bacterium]
MLIKGHPLWFYIKKHKAHFLLGMFFLLLTNLVDGLYPLVIKRGIDQIVAGQPFSEIAQTAVLFFLTMSFLAATRYCWRVFFGRYHTQAAEDLRNRIFQHLTTMGPQFFKKNQIGELMSLITNDVQSFRQAIGSGVLVLVDGVTIIFIVLPLMFWLQPDWTLKTLVFLPLVPFLIWKLTQLIFSRFKTQQDKLAELSGFSQETVAGIRVIKSFAQEENQLKAYNRLSLVFEKMCNRVASVDALFGPVMQFGIASGTVILLFVAADDIVSGVASIGTFVAFQRYIHKMVWPMTALGFGVSQFQKGMASYSRIKDVLIQETDIPDNGQIEIKNFESLEVRNLNFQFPESQTPALKNIQFEIKAGQKVGLVGPVGSGKTTLLHLLTRLYPAPRGTIWVNGHEIQDITQRSLRLQMAMVPQEPFLFSDSISENMMLGLEGEATAEDVIHWAQVVDIKNEIDDLPHQFQSELGERGVNLSGGQKQRLTIARGLMTRAPLILLDDSLSAVDHKTEKTIQAQLNQQVGTKKTQVIVSHRLSAVENADQILVLNQGEIEAIGTHTELIQKSPTYRRMAEIQGYRA